VNAVAPRGAGGFLASDDDAHFMAVALALGDRNLGAAWPNPSVGALVVDDRGGEARVVARGVTQVGGRPHAERVALESAGEAARGATMYVSLEPCSHHGKTPPCVDAILSSGVARVVTALTDPDPRVSGRGHDRLIAAGVDVRVGVLAAEATRSHRGHITRVTMGRPALTVKLARTNDGFAGTTGARLHITGPGTNALTHLRRVHSDAVMIGVETALADDPLLTVRLPGLESRSPVRVVIDSRLRLPPTARLIATIAQAPVWILATVDAPIEAERALVACGAEIMRVDADGDGRVDLPAALRLLADRGLTRILCEGGPRLAGALAAADLVDETVLITGEVALGGDGIVAVDGHLEAAITARMVRYASETVGRDRIDCYERIL
jgi:diaminohydroxyphosphoribosylaminopyrimidine deaminase/5-amino-6-(5-phosphoribosylamino)uracil reductase